MEKDFKATGNTFIRENVMSEYPDIDLFFMFSRIKRCPRCGEPMRRRNGKYGEFWGCEGYPDCRYTEDI